jgi:hypothetical protein
MAQPVVFDEKANAVNAAGCALRPDHEQGAKFTSRL